MNDKIKIIYDGDCPFCNNFYNCCQPKKNLKNVVFLNARESIEAKEIISNCKLNIDKGMIVSISGKYYLEKSSNIYCNKWFWWNNFFNL